MNRLINRTMRWMSAIMVVAVLFGACSKDDEQAWMTLDSESLFLPEFGQTATVGFFVENIKSISVLKIPAGWEVTADLATRLVTVKAPVELGGESKAVRSGTVTIIGYSFEGNSNVNSLFLAVSGTKDLSDMQSNSFIVSEPFTEYSFDATRKGETSETMAPADVRLIWQTTESLVKVSRYSNGKFIFYADGLDNILNPEGNALVGAYDAADNLIWTWHLWFVDAADVKEQTYANGKTFLSLNLGARGVTNKTPEEVLASYGLFYQWGRKTPFVGPYTYDAAKGENAYLYNLTGRRVSVNYVAGTAETGTVDYAAANPMSFILGVEDSSFDWLYSSHSDVLWGDTKTANDPCPKGWRIPSKNDFAGLAIEDMASGKENQFGWNLTDGTVSAYYPGAGFRPYLTGRIQNVYNPITGVEVPKPWVGYYWTNGTDGLKSSAMYFWLNAADVLNSGIEPSVAHYRANGMQVRCVKE